MTPRDVALDVALEEFARLCAAGLTYAEIIEALDGTPWLFGDTQPQPSHVVECLRNAWRSLPVVTLHAQVA